MEVDGALAVYKRSLTKHGVKYITYLGDGDSKAYKTIAAANVYEKDFPIQKLECV